MRRPPPKHRLPLLLTCLLPCLGACSGVRTDATPGANLAAATTYAWMIPPPAGAAVRRVADDLLRHRLEAAVEGRLAARGMRKVARDSADVLVHAGLSVTAKVQHNDPYFSLYIAEKYEEGAVIVELYRRSTEQRVWRGEVRDRLRTIGRTTGGMSNRLQAVDEERVWRLEDMVKAILARLPAIEQRPASRL